MTERDELKWRKRFLIFYAIRLLGVLTFFAGVAIIYTDVLRHGGWPVVGAIIAAMGAIDATFAPRLLKRHWDEADKR